MEDMQNVLHMQDSFVLKVSETLNKYFCQSVCVLKEGTLLRK